MSIRRGVFETNSSSTHSISICDNDELYDTLPIDKDGSVYLFGGPFGWGYSVHGDAMTKANYCAVVAYYDKQKTEMLFDVIKEQTCCENVTYDFLDENGYVRQLCYIDHQSTHVGLEVFKSHKKIRNFIFNPKSILTIDNDNVDASIFVC